jgi:hypothetical protein
MDSLSRVTVCIVGAGPYGVSIAAHLQSKGEDNEDADSAEPSLGSVSNFAHSNKSGGRTEAAATSSKTMPNPASPIMTD